MPSVLEFALEWGAAAVIPMFLLILLWESRREAERYRKALRRIRADEGEVCRAFDICSERDCVAALDNLACKPWRGNDSSARAWFIADAVLRGEDGR